MVAFHVFVLVQSVLFIQVCNGFHLSPPNLQKPQKYSRIAKLRSPRQIHVQLSSSNQNNDNGDKTEESRNEKRGQKDDEEQDRNNLIPSFFSRLTRGITRASAETDGDNIVKDPKSTTTTSTLERSDETTIQEIQPKAETPKPIKPSLSPADQARQLKAQAERARLEAERMDAELTLQKIERLERELSHAKAKGSEAVEDLQKQMASLQGKLNGDKSGSVSVPPKNTNTNSSSSSSGTKSSTKQVTPAKSYKEGNFTSSLPQVVEPFDQKEFDEVLSIFKDTPEFLKKLICAQLGFEYPTDGKVNATEIALRLDEIRRFDFSFSKDERPKFTQQDIDEMKERLQANWLTSENAYIPDGRLKQAAGKNETELALLCLEYEYFNEKYVVSEQRMSSMLEDKEVLDEISSAIMQGSFDGLTESLFPPCTRKEGQEATLAQAEKLAKEILPKAKFTSTSKPLAVPGGYVIKGESKAKNGDALIEAIDEQISKSSLRDKVTVCFLNDFTPIVSESFDDLAMADEDGAILFVGGANIAREPRKVLLSTASAIGLGTCWYLSLYPFLLNPSLAKQVDEQLALVEANMPADLSWLTDLSFPLFVTFVGLQVAHEIGHRIAAAFYDIKPTFPTFVPSIITGVTSLTTSFKEPPKNLQAMFDFSIAGPLFGMIASIIAIFVGTGLSASADPANFPALPLGILMQSSLGGGIIEAVLGPGVLNVPDAARGTQAVASMTIRLHPVAVAGYISLIVNALSMLPVGTTDGGRIAMALFGRQAKLAVGSLTLLALLLFGIQGSDLFLFYYAFCLAFQQGNEIPCRNEVDTVDFSRVLVATGTYFLALLALIPIQ